MQNPFIDFASNVGANIGGGLANYAHETERRRQLAQKQAQERLGIIQKLGQVAQENKDGQAMAGFANQMPGLLKQGYDIDVPNRPVVGSPILERRDVSLPAPSNIGGMSAQSLDGIGSPLQDRSVPRFGVNPGLGNVADQMPSLLPPKPQGAMVQSSQMVDTGRRDFNNPASMEASRRGLMLAAPKPEYDQWDPYKDVVDTRTGKIIRGAKDRPVTPHYVQTYSPDGTATLLPAKPGLTITPKPAAPPAPHYVEDYQPDGTVRHVPVKPGMVTRPKPPASTAEDKEIAKRREAATIVGRAITKAFGGVAKVQPGTADIEIGGIYPLPEKNRRMLQNAAIDMGGFLYEEPGQAPRIILNPGSTASGVASKLRDPALTWAANIDGSKTLVEKKAGVTSAAPPPKPVAPKAPPKWTPEMDSGARRDARQMVADENAGMVPSGPEGKRDVEDAYKLLKAQRMRDMGIQGEKTALERLIEMDEQKKKGGKK